MNRNIRCYICNSVSNQELRDETAPLHHGPFYDDGTGYLCSVCSGDPEDDEYDDGLVYFYEDDDEN